MERPIQGDHNPETSLEWAKYSMLLEFYADHLEAKLADLEKDLAALGGRLATTRLASEAE